MAAPRTSPRRLQDAVLSLRTAGASFGEITTALALGNEKRARTLYESALASSVTPEERESQRALAGQRIERLLRSVWTDAVTPESKKHLPSVKMAAELIEQHARLFGYEAPREIIVHNPTTQELEAWVQTVMAKSIPQVTEANVIDNVVEAEFYEEGEAI